MKKILIICETINSMGGMQTFTRNLIGMFENDEEIIIDLLIEFEPDNPEYESIEHFVIGPKIFKSHMKKIPFLKYKAIDKFLKSKNYDYDCILINFPKHINGLKNFKNKIILVQHQTTDRWLKAFCFFNNSTTLIENVKNRVDFIVALSPQEQKELEKIFKNVVTIRHISTMKNREKKEYNNKILMAARFVNKHKRFDIAINLLKDIPFYELHIYGKGKDKNKIEKMIKGCENIYLHDATNNLEEELEKFSFLLLTSDYEGYPLIAIESIKQGLVPLIRNTFLSAEDIILDDNGLLETSILPEELKERLDYISGNIELYKKILVDKRCLYDSNLIKDKWYKLFMDR